MADSKNSEDDILRQTEHDIYIRLLPIIVVIAVLGTVGIIGNILAIIFFATKSKRTTTVNLIISLSIVDFIVCIVFIPNLIGIVLNVGNSQRFLCKLTHFLSLWTVASSCFLLWVISIDRHRKICKPFATQITTPAVKYIVAGIVIFSLALAIRNLIVYDTVAFDVSTSSINRTTTGYYCTVTHDPDFKIVISFFYALDFLLILMIWITITVTYSHAIFIVLRQRRKMKRKPRKLQQSVKSELSVRETSSDARAADDGSKWHISEDCDVSREENTESSCRYDYDNTCSSLDVKHKPPSMLAVKASTSSASNQSRRNTKDVREACIRFVAVKSVIERNLTIMMFAASIVFILSFLPFFVIRVIMRIYAGNGIDYELKTGIQFALKLPILNSVFNPIIYGVFNSKFRKFLKRGLCRF